MGSCLLFCLWLLIRWDSNCVTRTMFRWNWSVYAALPKLRLLQWSSRPVMLSVAPAHVAMTPHPKHSAATYMCWQELPQQDCPFKEDIRDVEGVNDPTPLGRASMSGTFSLALFFPSSTYLRTAQAQFLLSVCCFGIANVATIEVAQDI